jgi:hypothetical protein
MTAHAQCARNIQRLIGVLVVAVACSGAGGAQNPIAPTPVAGPEGWLTHSDPAYAFSISYPANVVVLPDSTPSIPGLVKRVRFQDREIASSPLADREPERFLIEIFQRPSIALETWLRGAGRLPPDAEVSRFSWPGAREAVAVRRQVAIAPNEFYYLSTDEWVYALTPMGDGSTMLGTFVLLR